MKRGLLLGAALLGVVAVQGQVRLSDDERLEREIVASGLIHSPLPLDTARSYEAMELAKQVLTSRALVPAELDWKSSGYAALFRHEGGVGFTFPTSTGKRAVGSPSDPDYATYGHAGIAVELGGENWEEFNRLVFKIRPACDGARVVNLNIGFENADSAPKAGYNRSSGSHLVNLRNNADNICFLDLGEYRRDRVSRISVGVSLKGRDRTTGDECRYTIESIELQRTADPEIVSGWQPAPGRIVYSTTGYMTGGAKTAIVNGAVGGRFELLDSFYKPVFRGNLTRQTTSVGEFDVADFSVVDKAGYYRLRVGGNTTPPFRIGGEVWENSLWRTLNFIFCQRCGYPVPGIHGTCHTDLCSVHDGRSISYGGGWHDAGDLSQQTLQTGDVTFALLEASEKMRGRNDMLSARLAEEAEWGLEFILRNRYGDGFRASSMGLLVWLDGVFGTIDDISSVRVQDIGFDNFLYAAYEAYAARVMARRDPMLGEYLGHVAREDFRFALDKHSKEGYGGFLHFYEHSYNTSESQYMATASWAASMLYSLTSEEFYAEKAAEFIRYTLDCQRTEPVGGIAGFFYRDTTRRAIVHYNHQSREQVYMQAMTALCTTQPDHPDRPRWEASVELYGDYLVSIAGYTAPYGMIPSGVYHIDEPSDEVSFQHSHLFTGGGEDNEYVKQLHHGAKLDEEHYLRRFPVGFGIFNGNNAVLLAMGKAAAICGGHLGSQDLMAIAREQLYWVVGKNPFGQSMIYGEGWRYPQMDTFSSGEMTGEMPVGIRSLGNEDIPYWPQTTNATYKEVWVTTAGKWMSLVAEF